MKFPKSLKLGCVTLVLLMGTTVIKMPIAGASPVAASPVSKEPSVSQLSGTPNGPWVDTVQRLVGLQEIPVAPGGPGGLPPRGDARLWLGADGEFCLVAEHAKQDVLQGRQEEMVELGTLSWWPAPPARQMLIASGRWAAEPTQMDTGLVLTGTLSWFPIFSPERKGASIDDAPCQVAAQYREVGPATFGPGKFSETLHFSADPTLGPEEDGEIEYLLVKTEKGRRLPYVGFGIP
jgi:hypothetical protein